MAHERSENRFLTEPFEARGRDGDVMRAGSTRERQLLEASRGTERPRRGLAAVRSLDEGMRSSSVGAEAVFDNVPAAEGGRTMSSRVTRTFGAAGVVALSLLLVQVALAEAPVSRFTAADQAAAKAVVLKATDVAPGMRGGVEKNAKAPSAKGCPGLWEPRQSDLVITGVAKSEFAGSGLRFSSLAQVYKTERMARLDWDRTVVHPGVVPCLRKMIAADADPAFTVVAVKRTQFPRIGRAAVRIRMIADVTATPGATPMRILVDSIAFGRGRTGVSLELWAPYADRIPAHAAEVRLAKLLAGRIRL